jgi:hypothetical protein
MRIELRKLWLSARFGINPLEEKTGIYQPNCVYFAKLEVCTPVLLRIQFLCSVTLCRRFEEFYYLHLQG